MRQEVGNKTGGVLMVLLPGGGVNEQPKIHVYLSRQEVGRRKLCTFQKCPIVNNTGRKNVSNKTKTNSH